MKTDLIVVTEHSRYEFDTTAKLFTRTPVHERASDLGKYAPVGVPQVYDTVALPGEGEPMRVYLANGNWIRSTAVKEITDLLEKVKA